ncbi:MAG: DUF2132 domain-containing protein [Gammaproteobacteria bacterium]|nr:DUF2132 domain-containing protein [Gammaproteobacteria bacterium]
MTSNSTPSTQSKPSPSKQADPLHGLTLAVLLERLVTLYGWDELARFVNIRCFTHDPSIKSSLIFLRRTPWARQQVEDLYVKYGHADWQESKLD